VAAAYATRLPYAAAASYDDMGRFPSRPPSPSASASPTPSAEASRAGNQAGEGRARPGRRDPVARDEDAGPSYTDRDPDGGEDADEPDGGDSSEAGDSAERPDSTDATDASEPPAEAAQPPSPPADVAGRATVRSSQEEPVLRILPLGSGLILIGCGLGLAFLALRVRRG
jgi:hypothetical protein